MELLCLYFSDFRHIKKYIEGYLNSYIISTEGYFSFKDTGLFEELKGSLRYVPQYRFWERVQDILKHERYLNQGVGLIK